jgi:hypothetical protein
VCTGIDNILKEHKIRRAAYHGGDLQGVDIIKLMEDSEEIVGKIEQLLILTRDAEKCKYSDDKIKVKCDDLALNLTILDSVFAACQRNDLNEDDLKDIQGQIDLTRKMGLLVTSKYHGVERHMVKNIRSIPGDIAKKYEYWMEKYHQDGVKLDMLH